MSTNARAFATFSLKTNVLGDAFEQLLEKVMGPFERFQEEGVTMYHFFQKEMAGIPTSPLVEEQVDRIYFSWEHISVNFHTNYFGA